MRSALNVFGGMCIGGAVVALAPDVGIVAQLIAIALLAFAMHALLAASELS